MLIKVGIKAVERLKIPIQQAKTPKVKLECVKSTESKTRSFSEQLAAVNSYHILTLFYNKYCRNLMYCVNLYRQFTQK